MGARPYPLPEPEGGPAPVPAPPMGEPLPKPVLCEMLVAAVAVPFDVPCTITDVPGFSWLTFAFVVRLTVVDAFVVTLTTLPEKSCT